MSIDEARIAAALREVLSEELAAPGDLPVDAALAEAELVLIPGREGTQSRELPLQAVLHKIVMVRDRLRLIEQGVNAAPGLDDLQRLGLELRITRVQESLVALAGLLLR